MATTVVFSGGPFEDGHPARALEGYDDIAMVVAADSGLHAAHAAGLKVDYVVGDMDSVSLDALALAVREGARALRHPTDKDASDLELALDLVMEEVSGRASGESGSVPDVVVVGSGSGRLDHLLTWVSVVGSPRYRSLRIDAFLGDTRLLPVHDRRRFSGDPGATVTLLALHGPASGVNVTGLRWPLHDETLVAGSSRGLSNELYGTEATVEVHDGVVTVVIPPHP